ncbi:DUF4199 domain-containing protein [Mesonia sp. K7]|uniref:DUF4199 domain-containing protein n=1 Tax=Mesonia sp. K7 TaxID=2218606 RepID=UPI000DA86DBD|nr:DUF4199 domain-containing protein [Mesonia sp. K7]PZD79523.1 DUF4199 domain-containing protein [Mesonia sp. K7]
MKNFRTEVKWAVIFTLFTLLWMWMEKSVGLHDELISQHAMYTMLIIIPYVILFYFALREKKYKDYNGNITWQQAFLSGSVVAIIIAILAPLAQYITSTYITPNYFANATAYAIESGMSKESAQMYFNLKSYIIQAVFSSLAMGITTSAIVALFVRNKKK